MNIGSIQFLFILYNPHDSLQCAIEIDTKQTPNQSPPLLDRHAPRGHSPRTRSTTALLFSGERRSQSCRTGSLLLRRSSAAAACKTAGQTTGYSSEIISTVKAIWGVPLGRVRERRPAPWPKTSKPRCGRVSLSSTFYLDSRQARLVQITKRIVYGVLRRDLRGTHPIGS